MLDVEDLAIDFSTYAGTVQAVRGISFHMDAGDCVALVGESGCGKSVTAQSLMRLLPTPPASVKRGRILFDGQEILKLSEAEAQRLRGREIGMVFQDPMTALNPTMRVGAQIAEAIGLHNPLGRSKRHTEVLKLLEMVGIPQASQRIHQYPHQLSGGLRQRVCIAIALACRPKLLIADEPTTALDVTVQAKILERLNSLRQDLGMGILLITHDLGIVAAMCSRVLVMYAGKIVESGSVDQIFDSPQHPYTQALLEALPRIQRPPNEPLRPIPGAPPDLLAPPSGCAFYPRCPHAMKICPQQEPTLEEIEKHPRACWLYQRPRS